MKGRRNYNTVSCEYVISRIYFMENFFFSSYFSFSHSSLAFAGASYLILSVMDSLTGLSL